MVVQARTEMQQMQANRALLCKLGENLQSQVGLNAGPTQTRLPLDSCPPHGQALPRLMHCVRGMFAQSPWQMERTLGMASSGAEEAEVLKPKEPGGPEAVGLREHLRGSGMGPSPHISRTVMLRKYCTYSVWFHRWNQAW